MQFKEIFVHNPRKITANSGGVMGFSKVDESFYESKKLNWNFKGVGGGFKPNKPSTGGGGGLEIFWYNTFIIRKTKFEIRKDKVLVHDIY